MKILSLALCIFFTAIFSSAQSSALAANEESHEHATATIVRNADGTMTYNGEYRFIPPPSPWELIRGSESTNFVFGFYRKDPGKARLESTFFAYDEEPYGYSGNIEERALEFLKRFYWSSYVKAVVLEKNKVTVLGGEGLALILEGKDPVSGDKVRSKVIFGKRGERVVVFYINQWRTSTGKFDLSAFDTFDRFAYSLKFLRKSFYEGL